MTASTDGRDHWPRHARQWALVGPPLRPCADDVAVVEREVAAWAATSRRTPRALLLGVTPELATMAWPAGTTLTAIDRSEAMIGAIFPTSGTPAGATASVGDWRALPHAAASFDVVLGDGCLSCLPFPAGYHAIATELRRVVSHDAVVLLRLFAAPDVREPLDAVARALDTGAIGSLHALKWRIAMSIQRDDRAVAVADILAAFDALVPDREALARRTGWPADVIATIDAYRGSDIAYSFPTAAEVTEALAPAFVCTAAPTSGYELGDRCPTLVLRPR